MEHSERDVEENHEEEVSQDELEENDASIGSCVSQVCDTSQHPTHEANVGSSVQQAIDVPQDPPQAAASVCNSVRQSNDVLQDPPQDDASVWNSVQHASDVLQDPPQDEANVGISDSPVSETLQHPVKETALEGKYKCSDDTACICKNLDDSAVESRYDSLLFAESDPVLNVRREEQVNVETGRHIDIVVKEKDSGSEDGGTNLQNKILSVKSAENRQPALNEGNWSETGGEKHHEDQSMSVLKYPDSDYEGHSESESTEEMSTLKNMKEESKTDKEGLLSGNYLEDIPAENVAKGVDLFKEFFEMIVRFILARYPGFNTKFKTVLETVLNEGNDQSTAVKHLMHFEGCSPTGVVIDLWAVRIAVTAIPSEGREEAFRWSTFAYLAMELNFGISSQLAREGFFCNTNMGVMCAFCGRYVNLYNLQQGQQQLNTFFQNHRGQCHLLGNIPFDRYGYDLANFVRHTANAEILCISGTPYARQGACRYAQQVRNIGLQNLAPSGSHQRPLLHPLPQPNLVEIPVRIQERAMNDRNAREPVAQPPSLVQVLERDNQPPTLSTHLTSVKETNVSGARAASILLHLDCPGATGTAADLPRRSEERETTRRLTTRHTDSGRTSRRSVRYGDIEHADVDGRIATFCTGREFPQTPLALACAGFFYNDDIPLLEHGREYPDCDYIHAIIRDSRTEQPALINDIVLAFVDSRVGYELMERGFRRRKVVQAVYQLIRRGERIDLDSVTEELLRRMSM